ncbi:MAG: hypothetical protein WCF57_11445 [Pyrinomonadaceae bacterium]
MTLDEETLKRLTREVAAEMKVDYAVSRVTQLAGSTVWCIHFTDGRAPFCNDFREYVGGPYEESLIRKRIGDYLASAPSGA